MAEHKKYLLHGTIGLVVCGGKSSRMGTDKSMLIYQQKPQCYHVCDMLLPFCEKVFISCNADQAKHFERGYGHITDQPAFAGTGPMGALLTAYKEFPGKDILFIGCDYPFLTPVDLRQFTGQCTGNMAVSFYHDKEAVYEPLLAWYPRGSSESISNMHAAGDHSLQHFLQNSRAIPFRPMDEKSMTSIDTHPDFEKVAAQLSRLSLTFF